jgi:hypothetical protein
MVAVMDVDLMLIAAPMKRVFGAHRVSLTPLSLEGCGVMSSLTGSQLQSVSTFDGEVFLYLSATALGASVAYTMNEWKAATSFLGHGEYGYDYDEEHLASSDGVDVAPWSTWWT